MKHGNKLKIAASLLMIFALLLTACQTQNPPASSAAPAPASSAAPAVPVTPKVDNMNTEGLPIAINPVTLKVCATQRPQAKKSYKEFEFFMALEKETNVIVDWIEYPVSQQVEKISLAFASDDLADVYVSQLFENINKYGNNGQLVPMQDLLAQFGPNVMAAMEQYPDVYGTMFDPETGNIYGTNLIADEYFVPLNIPDMFINKVWLDNLGLKVPETIDQFAEALRAFKTQDANKNGDANDEIPFSFNLTDGQDQYSYVGPYNLFAPFGVAESPRHFVMENGKFSYSLTDPKFKDALVWLNGLYAEGLIDPESFTNNRADYFAACKAKEVGVVVGFNATNTVGAPKVQDYEFIPILKKDGVTPKLAKLPLTERIGNGFAISSACKTPEIAMRWIDNLYTPLNATRVDFGPLGYLAIESTNPEYAYDFKPAPEGVSFDDYRFAEGAGWEHYRGLGVYARNGNNEAKKQLEKLKSEYYVDESIPLIVFNEKDLIESQNLRVEIEKFAMELIAKCIVQGNVETEWNNAQTRLKDMGLERYLELHQIGYDAQRAAAGQ